MKMYYRPPTGFFVTSDLFGGNHLFTHNSVEDGSSFPDALEELSLNGLRYPGGSVTEYWGEDFYAAPNTQPAHMTGYHTFVGLDDFLQFSVDQGQPVTLVLPISHLFVGDAVGAATRTLRADKVAEIGAFVADLLTRHPDVVFQGFEIGNEYWSDAVYMTSKEYGIVANAVAVAVQEAMDEVLGADGTQPPILMQMGAVWGRDFDEGAYADNGLEWWVNQEIANDDILNEMSALGRDAVDGLIEHYYYIRTNPVLTQGDQPFQFADQYFKSITWDFRQFRASWDEAVHGALILAVTEWGPEHTVWQQWGLRGAGVLLEMFEGLLRLGVDLAHVWPVEIDGPTDLAGRHDGGDGENEGMLTPIGEAFRLLSEHAVGLSLLDNGFSAADAAVETVEVDSYGSEDRFVVFITSRSDAVQTVSLDVSAYVSRYSNVSGERIVQDDPDAHWSEARWFATTKVLSAHELGSGRTIDVELDPYEVVMVEYHLVSPPTFETMFAQDVIHYGRFWTETINGTAQDDLILAHTGDDRLFGMGGDDIILGHIGNDTIHGGDGHDRLYGGKGHDWVSGDAGNDIVFGGWGNDTLLGGEGDDFIFANLGRDVLIPGPGNDYMIGGGGADEFVFSGRGRNDVEDFVSADGDRLNLAGTGAGSFADLIITDEVLDVNGGAVSGTLINYGEGKVFLMDVLSGSLSASDFHF